MRELQTTTLVRLLARRGGDHVNQRRLDVAEALSTAALRISERLGESNAMAAAASARSVVIRGGQGRNLEASIELAKEAVSLAEAGGDPDVLARALISLARAGEDANGRADPEHLERAVALSGELEDPAIASMAATHLGRAHEARGELREAFRFAELASRFADESGDPAARISAARELRGRARPPRRCTCLDHDRCR